MFKRIKDAVVEGAKSLFINVKKVAVVAVTMIGLGSVIAKPAMATGPADIFTALDISGLETAVSAALVSLCCLPN